MPRFVAVIEAEAESADIQDFLRRVMRAVAELPQPGSLATAGHQALDARAFRVVSIFEREPEEEPWRG